MRTIALSLFLALGGCTLAFDYNQCTTDDDCTNNSRGTYCTSDNLCSTETPVERLCKPEDVYPVKVPGGAVPIGALLRDPKNPASPDAFRLKILQFAVDEVNATVSEFGLARSFVLHPCDIAGGKADGVNALRQLVTQRKVAGIIGPTTAETVKDVADAAAASGVPLITPDVTDTSISRLPNRGFIFRLPPVDSKQGDAIGTISPSSQNNMAFKMSMVFIQDTYGEDLRQSFARTWTQKSTIFNKIGTTNPIPENVADDRIKIISDAVVQQKPPLAVVVVHKGAATFVRDLFGLPYNGNAIMDTGKTSQLILSDGGKTPEVLALAKEAMFRSSHLARVFGTAPLTFAKDPNAPTADSSVAAEFKDKFKQKYPRPADDLLNDIFASYVYDSFYVLAVAVGSIAQGDVSGNLVVGVLRRLTDPKNQLQLGPASYVDTTRRLSMGESGTLVGVTGEIRFNMQGDREPALFEKWSVDSMNPQNPVFKTELIMLGM